MKPFKANASKFILKAVNTMPCFFPKWLTMQAKYYCSEENDQISDYRAKENAIKVGSFLEGDFIWKATAVTIRVNHKELESIHTWIKTNASPLDYNPKRDAQSFSTNFSHGSGHRSLGWIQFNRNKQIRSLARIERPGTKCNSCYVTLDRLAKGFSYLTMYFFLSDKATEEICNTDVTKVERYTTFQSLNPFSIRFRVFEHHDRFHGVEEIIRCNFNKILNDVKSTANLILSMWKIKRSNDDLIVIADLYRNCDEPYFHKPANKINNITSNIKEDKTIHYFVDRFKFFYDIGISKNDHESFCEIRSDDNICADAFYIKSQSEESFEKHRNFLNNGLCTYDSHLFFSLLRDCYKQYSAITNYANAALLENKNKPEINHDILFHSILQLDSLEENILAIDEHISFGCPSEYHERTKLITQLSDLKATPP